MPRKKRAAVPDPPSAEVALGLDKARAAIEAGALEGDAQVSALAVIDFYTSVIEDLRSDNRKLARQISELSWSTPAQKTMLLRLLRRLWMEPERDVRLKMEMMIFDALKAKAPAPPPPQPARSDFQMGGRTFAIPERWKEAEG